MDSIEPQPTDFPRTKCIGQYFGLQLVSSSLWHTLSEKRKGMSVWWRVASARDQYDPQDQGFLLSFMITWIGLISLRGIGRLP